MILKGSKRGGASDLGNHLLKAENEHVEVHEIRGFVARDVVGALKEAQAISRGTRCRQFLFSLSLSPPEAESVPVKAFKAAIDAIEEKLGLIGQPRVIIFHEKEARRHAHCVWSRIDARTMTAIDQPHFKLKLQDLSRQLYIEHGWRMPEGLIDPSLRNPLNFDRQEWFQAKRVGRDPRDIKAAFQQCWAASDSGKAFRQSLQSRGYHLARGDRRAVVAVDSNGEIYAVARWANVRTKTVADRMGDIACLPSVADVQKQLAGMVREKVIGFIGCATSDFAEAAQALEARRLEMVERHRAARRDLQMKHDELAIAEAHRRSARFRSGLRGLWDRITGQHTKLRRQNELEVSAAALRNSAAKEALIDMQLKERRRLQREIKRERQMHLIKITRLHREIAGNGRSEEKLVVAHLDHIPVTNLQSRRRRQRRGAEP